jgi:hypothetical protein
MGKGQLLFLCPMRCLRSTLLYSASAPSLLRSAVTFATIRTQPMKRYSISFHRCWHLTLQCNQSLRADREREEDATRLFEEQKEQEDLERVLQASKVGLSRFSCSF